MRIAIVERSFWSENHVASNALQYLARNLADSGKIPIVVTLNPKKLLTESKIPANNKKVIFSTIRAFTDSGSPLWLRVFELMIFTLFVFYSLCRYQPDKVYVATNPPIFVPMAVRWYCQLFKKKYVYHLQDIHPEATQVVTGKKGFIGKWLIWIDNKTIVQAETIITLTKQMKNYILKRTKRKKLPIVLLDNASAEHNKSYFKTINRKQGFVYCGNAGRLQRIPLLIKAIRKYLTEGGTLPFVFAGGGVYKQELEKLAEEFEQVAYLGVLKAEDAAELMENYTYGLMPIEDEVTNYAFPSKSSSYVFSGCTVIAICGKDTSVGKWVKDNNFGYVVEPSLDKITDSFKYLSKISTKRIKFSQSYLEKLTIKYYVDSLIEIICI